MVILLSLVLVHENNNQSGIYDQEVQIFYLLGYVYQCDSEEKG